MSPVDCSRVRKRPAVLDGLIA